MNRIKEDVYQSIITIKLTSIRDKILSQGQAKIFIRLIFINLR